jgi:hypothetical protein
VRREDDVPEREQRISRLERLLFEHVEAGPGDAPRPERVDERRLVDDRPPGHVDEERGRLHQPQPSPVEQPDRLVRERACDDDDVGRGEESIQLDLLDRRVRRRRPRGDEDAQLPRREQARDLLADPAVADQAERPPAQTETEAVEPPAGPVSGAQEDVPLEQPVREREHQSDRGRGHRARDAVRRDRDGDPALGARLEVDEVQADAVAREDCEPLDAFQAARRHDG